MLLRHTQCLGKFTILRVVTYFISNRLLTLQFRFYDICLLLLLLLLLFYIAGAPVRPLSSQTILVPSRIFCFQPFYLISQFVIPIYLLLIESVECNDLDLLIAIARLPRRLLSPSATHLWPPLVPFPNNFSTICTIMLLLVFNF